MGTNMSNEVALDIVRAMKAAAGVGQPGTMNPYGQTVGTPPTGTNRPGWGVVDMGKMQSDPSMANVDLIDQRTVDPMGGAFLNSEQNMTPQNSDGGLVADGGGELLRRIKRMYNPGNISWEHDL